MHKTTDSISINHIVYSLYLGILGREPNPGEVDIWVIRYEQGMNLDELINYFTSSNEFQNSIRCNDKLFVPPGHFYSPIVNPEEVLHIIDKNYKTIIHGVSIDRIATLKMWEKLVAHIQRLKFPKTRTNGFRYFSENPAYCIGDASIYSAMIQEFLPKNIIEIGSGYSSACALDTADMISGHSIRFEFIDPYPELLHSLVSKADYFRFKLRDCPIQEVDINMFKQLKKNDILFIDSTHVLKTASDVHHELFNILPVLQKGVIVHLHDVFWPFEYPKKWIVDEKRSWNELYALRAFLMFQDTFDILFFNDYFSKEMADEIYKSAPQLIGKTGGSIWLRKVK